MFFVYSLSEKKKRRLLNYILKKFLQINLSLTNKNNFPRLYENNSRLFKKKKNKIQVKILEIIKLKY